MIGLILKIQNFGGCHGNMPTVCLSSIRFSSNNQDFLTYTLSVKNIWVSQNPVSGGSIADPWTARLGMLFDCIDS